MLCVGHVCVRKNQNAFIRALDSLAARHKFELRFCGAASENDAYGREFFSLVKARPWCVYHGLAKREELKALLRQATMLVLPSLEDNCPMAVLEAMAAGVPVVASRVGGLPDLIEEGKTGFFCDPLEAASMAAAVEKVLVNPAAAAEVARQARQRARERFHPRGHRAAAPRDLPGSAEQRLVIPVDLLFQLRQARLLPVRSDDSLQDSDLLQWQRTRLAPQTRPDCGQIIRVRPPERPGLVRAPGPRGPSPGSVRSGTSASPAKTADT